MKKTRTGYEQGQPTAMDQALPEVFATKQWGAQWRLFRLLSKWPEVVGAEVAQLTYPAFFRREALCIFVQNSAWMHHLQYVKAELITRINQHLEGQPITDIRWQLHAPAPPPPVPPAPGLREIDAHQEHSFCQMTEAIANRECREALQRLWRSFAAHNEVE
ncbi:MAG: DUF721 domain-containing protein [Desulfobulbus sp.]|jgi:hypothetical protein|uniref:DUF721 domain-containing protein n=1 Tax=Desulfobulbus sp. TaxID=895 RepID=UPI002850BC51|nr:DUF721 domain-containing protein [Desulfobulbus sp.]MDR2549418.1 DUF721 domain-containing protein [Desulfobulbus sp.]